MSKRAAAIQLTADNAEEQDEISEEAGTFEVANPEEIQQRVIKKAKRGRGLDQDPDGSGTAGIFASLRQSLSSSANNNGRVGLNVPSSNTGTSTGITLSGIETSTTLKLPSPSSSSTSTGLRLDASTSSGMSTGLKLGAPTGSGTGTGLKLGAPGGTSMGLTRDPLTSSGKTQLPSFSTGLKLGTSSSISWSSKASVGPLLKPGSQSSTLADATPTSEGPRRLEYLQQLQDLNTSVSQWISRHVALNPHVDLTPIFRDYEKHLENIEAKYNSRSVVDSRDPETVSSCVIGSGSRDVESESRDSQEVGLGSGTGSSDGEEDSATMNSEESGGTNSSSTGSSTESTPAIILGQLSPVQAVQPQTAKPPTETTPKEEPCDKTDAPAALPSSSDDDSLLTVRAKLFYKNDAEFVEVGVGTLRVQSSSKGSVHLLMRNDTSIGTVMLNVKATGATPLSCNKKSVLLVCPAPNPPLSVGEGPVTYLLRVKTEQLAEQLLGVIKGGVAEDKD